MSATGKVYVAFFEYKKEESYISLIISYLQYNGNEDELKKLENSVEMANQYEHRYEDYSNRFDLRLDPLIPEEAVDYQIQLNGFGFDGTSIEFQKFNGQLTLPNYEDDEEEEREDKSKFFAKIWNERLSYISSCFK